MAGVQFNIHKIVATITLNEVERRKLICKFCENNPHKTKFEIFRYFSEMQFKKTFTYNTIKAFESAKSFEKKRGSGAKCTLQSSQTRAKL